MNPQSIKDMIFRECMAMKVGQRYHIEGRAFRDAYRCGWPTIYNTPEEAFLSSMPGSAYGTFTVKRAEPVRDEYIIERHEEGDKRVYVDPDRRHLFKEVDGFLEYTGGKQ